MSDQPALAAELPRLLVFAEVARRRSFSAAAQALGLSRSTVSHHVAALEQALDTRLLERSSRAVRTTSEGERVLAAAEAILAEWVEAREALVDGRTEPRGTLVLTAPDVVAERTLAPVIAAFVRAYPDCAVDLRVTAHNLDLIRDHIDLAIRAGPLPDSELGARLLVETDHILLAAPSLIRDGSPRDPSELDRAPWLDHRARRRYASVTRGEQTLPLPARATVVVDSAAALAALAVRGAGFALLPELLVRSELERGELVHVCPGWCALPTLSLHAVIPSPRRRAAKVQRFVAMLVAAFAD
ncbi:LysR family transcriptional regulatory protein [Plesiocystis pacifica SIR-1]|uniref:LysR family transcriptional regulatory protein n=1 Tax=Plesiocystis pacifica SIR-1 TaxID=391625 RepID=A6GE34_9BACT|nr:LysR family transcriptional regulator [Plesiocystis pacifica]EDM75900.1 LysR family transcriptional regulatory protein [Plesiocystis pacifica SIR-1]